MRKRAIKLPMKRLGHSIEDWVANQSPMGNSSIIDAKAFEWVERLEENSEVIRQELTKIMWRPGDRGGCCSRPRSPAHGLQHVKALI
jgi:hypothetical protein